MMLIDDLIMLKTGKQPFMYYYELINVKNNHIMIIVLTYCREFILFVDQSILDISVSVV